MSPPKNKFKIQARNLGAVINDVEYFWEGGFGCVLGSWERGVKTGDVRVIGEEIFYARRTTFRRWWKCWIAWVPQREPTSEWIRDFKQAIFS